MRDSARKVLVSAACVLGLTAAAAPVLASAAASPAAAAAPAQHAASGLPTPGIYHTPIIGKVVLPILGSLLGDSSRHATDVQSSNWSGYADGGGVTYNSVAASWTQPAVNCGSASSGGGGLLGGLLGGNGLGDLLGPGGSAASFWVGLDGYTSASVEQLGTDSDCNGSTPSYYAWWEIYPNPSQVLSSSSYPVHPGDQITAWVASNSAGTSFYLAEKDTTAGWTFSTSQTSSGFARSSAEVVAEAPSQCNFLFCSEVPLSNFGSIAFGNANVINNAGNGGSLSSFPANEITMASNGKTEAVPSSLSADGKSFSISWQNP